VGWLPGRSPRGPVKERSGAVSCHEGRFGEAGTTYDARMEGPERLDRLTRRERDVYEVWKKHPDWSNAQIGMAVYMPAPHVIRRYKQNIREKVGAMVDDPLERLSPKMLAVHELDLQGLAPAEIGRRMRLSEFAVQTFLEVIEERRNPAPQTED
jgi:hypothetical protein